MATKTTRRRSTKTNEERAAEVDALHEQLNTAIASLVSADGWKAMLRATVANLGRYSANNMLLILAQCPHATQVRSFKQWKENGRSVRKGEKGLRIFAPMTVKKKDETGAPDLDDNGQEKKRTLFKTVAVFDISQTDPIEGEPAPEEPTEPAAYTLGGKVHGEAPAELWDGLTAHIKGHGYTVRLEAITSGEDGYTNPKTRVVGIQASDPEAHRVITLAHEAAHIECGHVTDMDEYRRHQGRMECEAESVAYIVAGVAGLDAALTSVPYVADWAGRTAEEVRETLAAASATVVRAARAILATTTATPDEAAETDEAGRAAEEAAHAAYQEVRAEMIETAQQREQDQPLSAAPEVTAPAQ
ncbi:ArdC-like ssDNA-binding domain-containing protein [Streptomyces scabiei]|uniref:ArdC-like ssDNA-binding domain-containing protein n=1 Tax=Streptomyces scabiei TaxID=1930 RepID=UPI00298FF362|nr:ArdC-like ssDNA-binding domain-containing protein [Streptomyces scabiei]MDW8810998.1 ArdC-like ssDNA-binding domain-containing protein [Streptomyces scabiei]